MNKLFIKEIYIKSFGCISDKTFTFNDGLNVLYGSNESGKTTLLSFVLFAFYGIKHKKDHNSLSFKDKYISWSEGKMEGSVRFVSKGLEYFIYRTFADGKTKLSLHCTTTGEEIKDSAVLASPGEYYFGVGPETFAGSAYMSGLSATLKTDSFDEINTKIRNIYESGSDELSYLDVKGQIDNQIADLVSNKRKNAIIPALENELYEAEKEINDNNKRIAQKRELIKRVADCENKIKHLNNDLKIYKNDCAEQEIAVGLSPMQIIICCLLLIFSVVGFTFGYNIVASFGLLTFFVVLSSVILFKIRKQKRKYFTTKQFDGKIEEIRDKIRDEEVNKAVLAERINSIRYEDEYLLIERKNIIESKIKSFKNELEALRLALLCLENAYNEMKTLFSPALSEKAGEILSDLSSAKYNNVIVDDKFSISVFLQNGYNSSFYLSRGTIELVYLSLRFALCQLLFKDDVAPIFLDDVFITLDTPRLKRAMDYITVLSEERQIFFATCKEDEYIYLSKNSNIKFIMM